jgi:hypothetical protein
MVPHINGKFSEFLNEYYHYDKHTKLYSNQIFENLNIFRSISKYYWTVIQRIEIQTQPECTVQPGSSPEKFPSKEQSPAEDHHHFGVERNQQ